MGETLAPAVGAEGHVKLQGEVFVLSAFLSLGTLCWTFCDLGRHCRDFWRHKHYLLYVIFNVFRTIIMVPS